ncbi:MAG: TIGR04282 family arsenosugar biosynthesis glycosyltransferase [Hyphomicrobiales bacterium]
MRRHVILFARSPRFGRVKTRLAHDIGKVETLRFYRNTLASVSKRIADHGTYQFSIALTPDIDVDDNAGPLLHGFELKAQGDGDLGLRMSSTFANLSSGPALIIGSDIPDIQPHHIELAFAKLGQSDAVFGPCDDGGYWLVGLKRLRPTPPNFMKKVRWSSSHTLKDTIATLPKHWKMSYINNLDDIDDGAAFHKWRKRQTMRNF